MALILKDLRTGTLLCTKCGSNRTEQRPLFTGMYTHCFACDGTKGAPAATVPTTTQWYSWSYGGQPKVGDSRRDGIICTSWSDFPFDKRKAPPKGHYCKVALKTLPKPDKSFGGIPCVTADHEVIEIVDWLPGQG